MKGKRELVLPPIENVIFTIRGERVIPDIELARIYGVETRILNQAVRRNKEKFPRDFMFQLNRREADVLRRSRSQSVILKQGGNIKYLPLAFTEYGAIMAATVLNSRRAVQMSVFVVRAFVRMRGTLLNKRELTRKLRELEDKVKKRLDVHETAIVGVIHRLMELLDPPSDPEPPRKRRIGFDVE